MGISHACPYQAKLDHALHEASSCAADDPPPSVRSADHVTAHHAPPGATPPRPPPQHQHRTPSKAHVAAFEIASNPAIRELAIAQSFLRAERSNHTTPAKAPPADGADAQSAGRRSLSAGASPWQTRGLGNRHDAADGFFVSTSALSTPSREGDGLGGAALGRANAMLSNVLDGLQKEVATARARRVAAEERCAALQQTSSLLAVKLDRVMQELHERRQTLTDLSTKVLWYHFCCCRYC